MKQIILITYINRSGSTFLANLLSSSPDICVCPEGDAVVGLFLEAPGNRLKEDLRDSKALIQVLRRDEKMAAWDLQDDDLIPLDRAVTGFEAFYALLKCYRDRNKPSAGSVVFKAERIGALVPKINSAARDHFPSYVKFISLVRDPRAVYASQKNTLVPGSPFPMSKNPVWTAIRWKVAQKQTLAIASGFKDSSVRTVSSKEPFPQNEIFSFNLTRNGDRIFHKLVKYEDLVSETGEVKRDIGDYLEIDLSRISPETGDLMLQLDEETRSIHPLADKEPRMDRIEAWKMQLKPDEVYLIEKTCRGYMQQLGYMGISGTPKFYLETIRLFQEALFSARKIYRLLRFHLFSRIVNSNA
jgi:hypothetical protein